MWKILRSVCVEVDSNVFLLTNLSQLKIIASLGDEENKEQQKNTFVRDNSFLLFYLKIYKSS